MKFYYCILFSFFIGYAISQNNFVTIKGRVLSSSNNESVENAFISLKLQGGYCFEQKTDTSGKYEFKFSIEEPSTCTVSISTRKTTKSQTFKNGFLANKDIGKIDLITGTIYIKDFDLTPVSCGPDFPAILFSTNSIISSNDSLNKIDSSRYETLQNIIISLVNILKEHPNVIIELQGHGSTIEKNHEQLSLYRAQVIKEILIAKGINRNRIMTKGWGNHKPLLRDDTIIKAKTTEEKIALHSKNQRVVFRIISWDFKE